jgi:hypothetical protein
MSASRPQRRERFAVAQLLSARAVWCSCEECGGVAVRVRDRRIAGTTLASAGECPRCETWRRRVEAPRDCPQVWYDTVVGDWVVQLPVHPEDAAARADQTELNELIEQTEPPTPTALLPLGVPFYDAPPATIYRAAADLVYAGEALDPAA